MDQTAGSSDPLHRAGSSEPPSTRPNPFDDNDIASRKRRRTSQSGSPSRSIDGTNAETDNSSTSATLDGEDEGFDSVMTADKDAAESSKPASSQDPASSKVTINLRSLPHEENMLPSTPGKQPHTKDTVAGVAHDENVDGNGPALCKDPDTASPAFASVPPSPPTRPIQIPDDDDDVDVQTSDAMNEILILGHYQRPIDPTEHFPYQDVQEYRHETVQRLAHYISSSALVDDNVIESLHRWVALFLAFTQKAERDQVAESLRANRNMWLVLPDIISAMRDRKPPLYDDPSVRVTVIEFYHNFVRLAAYLVELDIHHIQWALDSSTGEPVCPELFSTGFLQQLHLFSYRDAAFDDIEQLEGKDVKTYLLDKLDNILNSTLATLDEFVVLLIEITPKFPKLAIHLAHLSQLLVSLAQQAHRAFALGHAEEENSDVIRSIHTLWKELSACLVNLIEKKVTQLPADAVSCLTAALSDVLRICMLGSHKEAQDLLQKHQKEHENLPARIVPEAVASEWRFDILGKLIRSSQMQLRVLAATTMCGELVGLWRRLGEEPEHPLLKHLAFYLIRSQIIEYIIGPNCHPEIIVESSNIVGFLVVTKTYQKEHTDRLWYAVTSSQDPRVSEALTRMISTIINLFDNEATMDLCDKFLGLPMDAFTPPIRTLWEALLRQICNKAHQENRILEYRPYNLCLRILRESSICSHGSQVAFPEMQELAKQKFKELLTRGPDQAGRAELYTSCLEDVSKKSRTSLGSLWCLSMAIRPTLAHEMQILTHEHDLTKLIVDELENAVVAGQEMRVPAVLCGNTNLPRCEFVTNIILFQPASIDKETGKKLWDILVGPLSPCPGDREAGWNVLNSVVRRSEAQNPFIQTCLSEFLPSLHHRYFCTGLLDFVKEEASNLVGNIREFRLDDEASVSSSSLEQLWRIILTAEDTVLVRRAIHILAVDVNLENPLLSTYSTHRTRIVHSALVTRCFNQMRDASEQLRLFSDGAAGGDEDSMATVAIEEQAQEQRLILARSLQLLQYFHDVYQSKPHLSAPDLRSLMPVKPSEIKGDPAQLKYQSFDGKQQTEVRPLNIGRGNTAASLLASIREETGFQKYKVYYRGQPFLPDERQVCKSLEDLQIHEGLILVRREEEEDNSSAALKIRPGSSPLQIEIMGHFEEMWEYLSMEDSLARDILDFLIKLPADTRIMERFEDDSASHMEIFPPGQPFRSLYALYTLQEYKTLADRAKQSAGAVQDFPRKAYEEARKRSLDIIVQAIFSSELLSQYSEHLQIEVASASMSVFMRWLQEIEIPKEAFDSCPFQMPSPERLLDLLRLGVDATDTISRHLVVYTLRVILRLGLLDQKFWEKVTSNQNFASAIQKLLMHDARKQVREAVASIIKAFLDEEASLASRYSDDRAHPHRGSIFFWSAVSKLIPDAIEKPSQCHEMFEVANLLLRHGSTGWLDTAQLVDLSAETGTMLLKYTTAEDIDQEIPFDPVFRGLTLIFSSCLQLDESIPKSDSMPQDLAHGLFWRHLFPPARSLPAQTVPKVILNTDTRGKLCDIIFRLVQHDERQFTLLLTSLNEILPFYANDEDPYLYDISFSFDRHKSIRAPCGYVGLRNLSNTCYLNSLLTQLYMNTDFRQFMLKARTRDEGDSQKLIVNAKRLFGYMQESYRRFVDPEELIFSIKNYDDSIIDIHNQMDVDEFYNLLFDRFEAQLLTSGEKRELRSFYGGQLVQQVKSKECEHISERLEPFSAIQCDIKGKHSLQDSLQAYVDGEILEGDNKYKCSTCDRHVDAVKRACLKDLPDHMIFHLKRFDFNLRTLQRNKINDYFSFPGKIDLKPYTIDHLTDSNNGEEDIFELVGVLVHAGTAESGHYYSYIRERPSQPGRASWVEFNDENVTPWDPALMETSTFGGPDHCTMDSNGVIYDKSYSAYMLFYERSSSLRKREEALSQQKVTLPLRLDSDLDQKEHILDENTVYLRRHCLFDPSHTELVHKCFQHARVFEGNPIAPRVSCDARQHGTLDEDEVEHGLQDLAMEVFANHLEQIVSRKKELPDVAGFSRVLTDATDNCGFCALSFYRYFYFRAAALRSLIQRNPDVGIRQMAGNWFLNAVRSVAELLPTIYCPASNERPIRDLDMMSEGDEILSRLDSGTSGAGIPVIEGVIFLFRHLWKFFQGHVRAWDEHFGAVLGFAKFGQREVAYLLADDYLVKLCRILSADACLELAPNYSRMLQNILRRLNNRPPSYAAIITLLEYLFQYLEPEVGVDTIVESPLERLDSMSAPFAWTSEEVSLLHHHPGGRTASFFVEKLIATDQMPALTDSIIAQLIKSGERMDLAVLQTLKDCIRREDPQHPVEPFLRAAVRYIENSRDLVRVEHLASFIASQARTMHYTEGLALFNFFRAALNVRRHDEQEVTKMHNHCLALAPEWAPCLLVHPNANVRVNTMDLTEAEILHHFMGYAAEEDAPKPSDQVVEIAQRLGIACLGYLRDTYVRRRAPISRGQATDIARIIGTCQRAFETELAASEQLGAEFAIVRGEVMDPIRRLMVEEVEEDGSGARPMDNLHLHLERLLTLDDEDWEGSCGSSEQMDGIAEMSMQVMHDFDDTQMA